MFEQVWPQKLTDGRVYERHVYQSPLGEGYVDIFYSVAADSVTSDSFNHGPELRDNFVNFKIDAVHSQTAEKIKRISEGKAEWQENTGFKVKEGFEEQVASDGSLSKETDGSNALPTE